MISVDQLTRVRLKFQCLLEIRLLHFDYGLTAFAAIAAGFAAAFIAREVRPAFYDGRALAEVTGLPILGTVSILTDDTRKKAARRSASKFFAGVGALIGTYLAGLVALTLLSARAG